MEFLYFQSIVNYRVKVKEDGTLGSPEVTNKWTKDMNAPKKKTKPKPKPKVEDAHAEVGEVNY